MQPGQKGDVTGKVQAWSGGNQTALKELIPLLERQLHGIAQRCMGTLVDHERDCRPARG